MPESRLAVVLLVLVAAGMAAFLLFLTHLLGRVRRSKVDVTPYECGMKPYVRVERHRPRSGLRHPDIWPQRLRIRHAHVRRHQQRVAGSAVRRRGCGDHARRCDGRAPGGRRGFPEFRPRWALPCRRPRRAGPSKRRCGFRNPARSRRGPAPRRRDAASGSPSWRS